MQITSGDDFVPPVVRPVLHLVYPELVYRSAKPRSVLGCGRLDRVPSWLSDLCRFMLHLATMNMNVVIMLYAQYCRKQLVLPPDICTHEVSLVSATIILLINQIAK